MIVALCCVLSASPVHAATPKPTPTIKVKTAVVPSAKATVKATAKSSAKPTATPKAMPSARASSGSTTKTQASPSPSRSTVKKRVTKRIVRITPPPTPSWPLKGFYTDGTSNSDVFARIPTKDQIASFSSGHSSLATRLQDCLVISCGAVQVASYAGCAWWEVTSTLYRSPGDGEVTRTALGKLRTLIGKSKPQQILTVLLMSKEPLTDRNYVDDISIICHRDTPTDDFPQYQYTPISG